MPVKITDETQNSVVGNGYNTSDSFNWLKSGWGSGMNPKGSDLIWFTGRRLAVSPDGASIAYISLAESVPNIMVCPARSGSAGTQRTFRRAATVSWGPDNQLYFNDNTAHSQSIGSVNAKRGSLIKQLTSNNNDWDPIVSKDGSLLYFTRYDASGPSVWSLNLQTNELTNCTRGYNVAPAGDNPMKILVTRNSSRGTSEIWLIDLENGDETLLLSDAQKGFTNPQMSPDGDWILVVGNSYSPITKKQNTDIYAVRSDGSQLTQITYHPEIDCSPVWSPDGKYIYFLSSRGNRDKRFNIWRINNPLI